MRDRLVDFVAELRATGIPVSMVEVIDAAEALEYTDLTHPDHLRATLGATLVKRDRDYPAFDRTFDVFFGRVVPDAANRDLAADGGAGGDGGGTAGGDGDPSGLADAIVAALLDGDRERLRALLSAAVDSFAGMQPGRPVGGRYYSYRVMSRLGADDLVARLMAALTADGETGSIDEAIVGLEAEMQVSLLREELEHEITSRLVTDRGAVAVAASRRIPLIEDTDLMHATRTEIALVERAVAPLARKLATRLHRRNRRSSGTLDVRRTIRRSLSHGGVLLEPQFRPRTRSKPELVILCDISGSMATFSRFTMQLAYAISSELSKVRVFAFIDGLDEVTEYFGPGIDFIEGLTRVGAEADVVRSDGHSDYGAAFGDFVERHLGAVTARSTVIVAGDARTNYRDPGVAHFEAIAKLARAVFWLNPEPVRYWDTGDSVMSRYRHVCDRVEQVRTLRQLERFVELASLPTVRRARTAS
ncbi:MAG: VWA domain-containing protein [Acidimicrobiia bacterium]|nr:VWA domain-containing protein [Acidimicrobiia bacterium]